MKKALIIIVLVLVGGFIYSKYEAKAPITSESPVVTASIAKTVAPKATVDSANIHIFSPKSGEKVGTSFMIVGEARVFENQFLYRVRDENGAILAAGNDYANAPDVGQYGSFGISISNIVPKGTKGTVEVYSSSAKDGSEVNLVKVSVLFK